MSLLSGRNRAGPVSRWHLKPHHQILVVTLAALVAFTTVGIVIGVRLAQIDHDHTRFARHAAITDALTESEFLFQSEMAEASQLLAAKTSTDRGATITDLSTKERAADREWDRYKELATPVSGEAQLRNTAEHADARQSVLIAPALIGRAPAPGAVEDLARVSAIQIGAIETLRARYAEMQSHDVTVTANTIDRSRRDLLVTTAAELAFLLLACRATYVSVRRRYRQFHASEAERAVEGGRDDLEARVARALEMVNTEDAAYVRVARALGEVAPGERAQVLVADSSRAHLRQTVGLNLLSESGGCSVGTPRDCPAITRGQTQLFADSAALDACPYLADRPHGPCSATCVPVSIGGESIGVMHLIGEPKQSPDSETTIRLEIISRKAGDRIGMLRAFDRSETEARTDQLTGLLNRRSLEHEVRELTESSQRYTVAYGDLDHFKQLNDVYGHDAGDRALRLFSRVLRDSVRPRDIPARYGGEEFVVVLPDCTVADAAQVLERVRENLGRAQSSAAGPPFTVSFGLSDSESDANTSFEDMLKSADRALGVAKQQGRDRIVATALD